MARRPFPFTLLLLASAAVHAQQKDGDEAELLALLNTPVVSASKSEQSIGAAPAKIVAITAEDIRRRGYQDLEEIFHDLAGMDFAFGRGVEWSTIFMRGMRTDNTDHFLMIWDGVIQNDTWKYNLWLSRQYPILNIERIEVMYGPSSLLYGANAFGGIVNVILKKPKDAGTQVQVGGGAFKTRWAEVNLGREMGDWRFSFNGRSFRSDEMDTNGESWVDNAGRRRYYNFVLARDGRRDPLQPSGYVTGLKVDTNGVPHWRVNGVDVPFDGRAYGKTNDWFLQAGVGWKGWELRTYFWSRHEMEDSWYVPIRRMHGPWTPVGSAVYLTHDKPLSERLSMKSYMRMVTSGLDPDASYDAGFSRSINNPASATDLQITSLGTVDYYKLFNREWRAGQQFNYGIPGVNAVFGWEWVSAINYEDYNIRRLKTEAWKYTPQHDERNLAAFANVQADLSPKLSLAAGFRYDYNSVAGEKGGFGHLYTGRMAAVISPTDKHRFKVIYGQAFQAPSPWQKFATVVADRVANPFLKPERMASTELIWEYAPIQRWRNSVSVYYNQITDQIALGKDPVTSLNQQQNKGGLRIFGQEYESRYFMDAKNAVYATLTFNSSKVPETGATQGGLAEMKATLGADLFFAGQWALNVRGHFMSDRDVPLSPADVAAELTSRPANFVVIDGKTVIASAAQKADAYFTVDTVVTWTSPVKGLDVRAGIYNVFNESYYDPGTRIPDGRGNNSLIIQQPRRAFLSMTYRF